MTTPGYDKAVEGMVDWAQAYLQQAKAELDTTTQKAQQGSFTADDAVDAMVRFSNLWFNGMTSFASEMMDAATTVAKFSAPKPVSSFGQHVGQAGTWELAIHGPATKANGQGQLAESRLTVDPDEVDGTADTFVVTAEVDGASGGTYHGTVRATSADGQQTVDLTYFLQL